MEFIYDSFNQYKIGNITLENLIKICNENSIKLIEKKIGILKVYKLIFIYFIIYIYL
jgi:hypothetical protein